MKAMVSVEQLAAQVNQWCQQHRVIPANGQAGERVSERNIRYYRTLGLVDPPLVGGGQGYGEKHFLQLVAIRLLQAQGLPLNRIRNLLYGRSLEALQKMEREGPAEWQASREAYVEPGASEAWGVTSLDDEFIVISRRGRTLSPEQREQVRLILNPGVSGVGPGQETNGRRPV